MSNPTDPTVRLRRGTGTPADAGRSLAAAAALAGLVAAGVTLVICMSLALTGWFLADAGAHGDTTDALRAGADGWLVGHGSRLDLAGLRLGMTPLALTMMLLLGTFRAGRWATRRADGTADDRTLATAAAALVGCYVVIAVLVCVVATQSGATPGLGRTVLGALLVGTVGGGLGLASGTGRLDDWLDLAPRWARELAVGAAVSALALVAAGAALVAISLLFSFNEASSIYSGLGLSAGDALTFTFLMLLMAPNAALLGSAYLLGPGFAFGTGTTVTPTAVGLGAVPAFPILAALPDDGPPPGWLVGVLVVPAVCAAVGTVVARRDTEPLAYDLAALRGAGTGFAAGVLITIAIALAGGPLGTGRLSEIGAPLAEVLMFSTGIMGLGGLIGGMGQAWAQRRRH
ncbi:hypothetical protein EFK50_05120 [Nocardioides marmoriginsengisoli]|uniref:Uncharacterized protein n=2 Tax=Nocardioides marmoriginsengisoli TaxID=661483 RepID=A0A3N0CPW1_9ACTN|nr:hypothetical protein EFK50_05120 [Nocardioides marmoriginsengisoli]